MTVHQESRTRSSVGQDAQALRAELDELLRARQYASQRERRLGEAVRAVSLPGRDHGYAQPQQQPDPELLRQLDHARQLRESLGARCLELSEHLLTVEDRLRRQDQAAVPAQAAAPAPTPAPAPEPRRKRPTGARFGGAYEQEPAAPPAPAPPADALPAAAAPRATGARFGGGRATRTDTDDDAGGPPPADSRTDAAGPAAAPPAPAPAPQPRTPAELAGLAERIAGLHRRGSAQESAALVAQAAVTLAPADVARLTALLRSGGPAGAAAYLARAVAHGTPGHAAGTLAELRRAALVTEAAELFHALWGYPAAVLPELLAALEGSGQGADGQTLLWEWGSAPPADLAALAERLHAAGRAGDTRTLLRQAAARPGPEISALAAALAEPLAGALLRELVALRQPAELAQVGGALAGDPGRYGTLLAAVAEGDPGRRRAAEAALRAAGLPTEPPAPRSRRSRR
ncbi:hypothetical protein [Kitasatospora herbaricolor]|uniref:hypothetical protein n=1 Tax=Kitasatospora herbaricolor TaxID=68217 RepID=UPI0036DA25D0